MLTLAIAFLRFYDVQDFPLLGFIANPRLWSNRFTVAALVATLVNFGVVGQSPCAAWNRRNCLATRFTNEKQTAWLKQDKERLRQESAKLKQENERLRLVNEKLDEIDAKYDALRRKSGINSTLPTTTDEN